MSPNTQEPPEGWEINPEWERLGPEAEVEFNVSGPVKAAVEKLSGNKAAKPPSKAAVRKFIAQHRIAPKQKRRGTKGASGSSKSQKAERIRAAKEWVHANFSMAPDSAKRFDIVDGRYVEIPVPIDSEVDPAYQSSEYSDTNVRFEVEDGKLVGYDESTPAPNP